MEIQNAYIEMFSAAVVKQDPVETRRIAESIPTKLLVEALSVCVPIKLLGTIPFYVLMFAEDCFVAMIEPLSDSQVLKVLSVQVDGRSPLGERVSFHGTEFVRDWLSSKSPALQQAVLEIQNWQGKTLRQSLAQMRS